MDADLSHDTADVPRLLAALSDGSDLVIGSRYIGGVRVLNWPANRLILSLGNGVYVRTLTGLPLADPTSGFKAFNRKVLESLDWSAFRAEGYGFTVETHFQVWRMGFLLREVPIVLTERGVRNVENVLRHRAGIRVAGGTAGTETLPPGSNGGNRGKANSYPPGPAVGTRYFPSSLFNAGLRVDQSVTHVRAVPRADLVGELAHGLVARAVGEDELGGDRRPAEQVGVVAAAARARVVAVDAEGQRATAGEVAAWHLDQQARVADAVAARGQTVDQPGRDHPRVQPDGERKPLVRARVEILALRADVDDGLVQAAARGAGEGEREKF